MKLEEFLECYNNIPIGLDDFALMLVEIEDNESLVKAAKNFLDATRILEEEMDECGLELG